MIPLLILAVVCAIKVTISPKHDQAVALSLTNLNHYESVFTFAGLSRADQRKVQCMYPIIVPKGKKHRIYFCGELMCINHGRLSTCSPTQSYADFDIKQVERGNYRISQDNICLTWNYNRVALEICKEKNEKQIFTIQFIKTPKTDNLDVDKDSRSLGVGNRELIFDEVARQLSRLKNPEFVVDIVNRIVNDEIGME